MVGVSLGLVARNGTLDTEVPSMGLALRVPFALPISVTLMPVILILTSTAKKYVSSEMSSGIAASWYAQVRGTGVAPTRTRRPATASST